MPDVGVRELKTQASEIVRQVRENRARSYPPCCFPRYPRRSAEDAGMRYWHATLRSLLPACLI